jgi:hypothetical protein
MVFDKKKALQSILESTDGIHLTIYLENQGNREGLLLQLKECIQEAHEFLQPVMTIEERMSFLEPLDSILGDKRIFENMQGHLGLFRTKEALRVLSIPIEVKRQCHVANSFHVKPLLRWMQIDKEFFMLDLSNESVSMYFGNQSTFQKIGELWFTNKWPITKQLGTIKKSRKITTEMKIEQLVDWISEVWKLSPSQSQPIMFVHGEMKLGSRLSRLSKNVQQVERLSQNKKMDIARACAFVRDFLRLESAKMIQKTLIEFRVADELNLTKKNIFQIAKAAVQGKIRKLVVAEEVNIFGKVDRETGGLALHPFDLDHEDDDILDDIAQAVLSNGGEVIVVSKQDIPQGRPAVAIVAGEGIDIDDQIEDLRKKLKKENDSDVDLSQ